MIPFNLLLVTLVFVAWNEHVAQTECAPGDWLSSSLFSTQVYLFLFYTLRCLHSSKWHCDVCFPWENAFTAQSGQVNLLHIPNKVGPWLQRESCLSVNPTRTPRPFLKQLVLPRIKLISVMFVSCYIHVNSYCWGTDWYKNVFFQNLSLVVAHITV